MAPKKKSVNAALENLTPQRRKFVLAFCDTFKATKAALAAGYSEKTARTQGSYLLTLVDIKAAIKGVFSAAGMDPEEIAARWDRIARADLTDFYTKVEYFEPASVKQSLFTAIAEIEEKIKYEFDFMLRSWEVLELPKDKRAEELLEHDKWVKRRRVDILRYQMQLEKDPAATRLVDGPPVKKYRMELDLVKAADLGLLDLIKILVPTENGTKLELRSPDAALDNLAKWRGMLVNKVDLTSGGEPVAQAPILGVLTLEQKKELLAAKRKANALAKEGGADA